METIFQHLHLSMIILIAVEAHAQVDFICLKRETPWLKHLVNVAFRGPWSSDAFLRVCGQGLAIRKRRVHSSG